jgi:hypothetical protein
MLSSLSYSSTLFWFRSRSAERFDMATRAKGLDTGGNGRQRRGTGCERSNDSA